MRPQPLDLEIDFLDLEHGHVQQHVGFVATCILPLGLRHPMAFMLPPGGGGFPI